jgi:ribosome recycling factor
MTDDLKSFISAYEKSLNKPYVYMLYCFMNLCTKSEPMALLSMTVKVRGGEFELEKVARASIPDDDHFCLQPYRESDIQPIIRAVMEEHPEFTPKPKLADKEEFVDLDETNILEDDPRIRVVLCTIPPVDKDRRDLLMNLVDGFYDNCKKQMEEEKMRTSSSLVKKYSKLLTEKEMDEAKQEMDKSYECFAESRDKLKDSKVDEIEEAYQRYLERQSEEETKKQEKEAAEGNFVKASMNMFADDDE